MLTYVINTSENRTLDSDRLFELAGYNKIRWINSPLTKMRECAEYIYEKQNFLKADKFRIAILVDFYNFDRIRPPYGRMGYRPEVGVDISAYMPYIEAFLLDNLISYLENRGLYASDFEVYYVQNSKLEKHEFLDNAEEQISQILSGSGESEEPPQKPVKEDPYAIDEPVKKKRSRIKDPYELDEDKKDTDKEEEHEYDPLLYPAFDLYCTPNVTLTINLADYPYGAEKLCFLDFLRAFSVRNTQMDSIIRRHYYISNYGGGQARAALDTLTLSLYLINMYEREESLPHDGEVEIEHIDPKLLGEILEHAWVKINRATVVAQNNNSTYYSLDQNFSVDEKGLSDDNDSDLEALTELHDSGATKQSAEQLYERICYYHDRTPEQLAHDNREEFSSIMKNYLARRDATREISVEDELEAKMVTGLLVTTPQFPSKEEYLFKVKEKENEISARFEKALAAEYIHVDYSKEKEEADIAFDQYSKAKACLKRNIIGDIIFLLLSVIAFVVPYILLQISGYNVDTSRAVILVLLTCAMFTGLFILATIIQLTIIGIKLSKAKTEILSIYTACYQKDRLSMSQIRNKYYTDLIYIEHARYELRRLKYLYEDNLAKDSRIKRHRDTLQEVGNRISGILNNLNIIPVPDPDETVYGEFDINKPILSRENKVYRVFSLETIEKLFPKKGRGEL